MKMIVNMLFLFVSFNFITACQTSPSKPVDTSKALSAEEVSALFTNKTFDGHNELKGTSYQIYSQDDGAMIHKNTTRIKKVNWEVKPDGQHCAIFPKKTFCGLIIPMGNGVYHKISNGVHTRTLKNFVEGNQITM